MRTSLPLHNAWTFFEPKQKAWLPARVPGCVHTDLHRNGLIPDPFWGRNELDLQWIEEKEWRYRAEFSVDSALLQAGHVDLVADGLDTLAKVVLNGTEIARTENMFIGWRWPVKELLREDTNTIEITFASVLASIRARMPRGFAPETCDPVGGRSLIRKEQRQFGWDWGPRFVTCGIWKPLSLEAWSENRIASAHITQTHGRKKVTLRILPELAKQNRAMKFRSLLSFNGETVAEADGLELVVKNPQLWWPNDMGAQPIYDLDIELHGTDGALIDKVTRRIGLRTIELDRHRDKWGESFQFKVNGVPFFAKGANWIPAHAFATEATRDLYDDLLTSAASAHMNMIRVWGGGIYETEDFYDLCDEKGLLVWQDFMFACALYPGNSHFLSLVRHEAAQQVKRLAHRACLALWCGNNEIEQMPGEILKTRARKKAYEDIFYKVLPDAVAKYDGVTAYWPSSPHNPEGWEKSFNNERAGDCHFWDVWHARFPVKRYEEKNFRFCSEFGMQSYNSPEVAETFCPPGQMNIFGPVMENHQKNPAGNQIIVDYISRRYRYPKNYAALTYLSQINQAYCMKIGAEHFRRIMPRCMGALYWQINDCWPVASWSSIEFGGNWKALHYETKRFFAPALVSAHVPGDETAISGNYLRSTIHDVNLFTVYDEVKKKEGTLKWALHHLDGRTLRKGKKAVTLRYGQSIRQLHLDFAKEIAQHRAACLYLRAWLEIDGAILSQDTVLFTAPRFMDLPLEKTVFAVRELDDRRFGIEFRSPVFQHRFQFHVAKTAYRASDNFFDLYPNIPHRVRITLREPFSKSELTRRLTMGSLADSY